MQAKELMIDDIVRIAKDVLIPKGTVVSINGIDANNHFAEKHLVGSVSCLPINDKYGMTCGVWVEYLEPIPITPEILEKIGFEKWDDGGYIYDQENTVIEVAWVGTILKISGEYVNLELPAVIYVHQLQHALRLCRISIKIGL